jgi:hypothetical protein
VLVPRGYEYNSQMSACATAALKVSFVTTSKYAQVGMEVADGTWSGNL